MDEDTKELLVEIGRVVEAAGRMLRRERPLTLEDLKLLSQTLTASAGAIDHLRGTIALHHV